MAKIYITQKNEGQPAQVETIKTKLTADEIIKLIRRYDKKAVII